MSTPSDPISFMATWGSVDATRDKEQGFEGPEKRLELIIRFDGEGDGLRQAPKSSWETVVGSLNAQIVSSMGNDELDAYVLTESSLFVSRNRILLITCGTTTLLDALPHILKVIGEYNFEVEWASFMRKNFSYPWEQKGPHASMEAEYTTLKSYFPKGHPFVFGPVDADHYFFYAFDDLKRPLAESDTQMSMTMYDMDPVVAEAFWSEEFYPAGEETAKRRAKTGLDKLFDGWNTQDLQFAPCGYSVNSILDKEYQTIHITPESHCSFASYETNSPAANLQPRMSLVLSIFRPQRFTVIVMLDPQSEIGVAFKEGKAIGIEPEHYPDYTLKTRHTNEFAPGYTGLVFNYVSQTATPKQTPTKTA